MDHTEFTPTTAAEHIVLVLQGADGLKYTEIKTRLIGKKLAPNAISGAMSKLKELGVIVTIHHRWHIVTGEAETFLAQKRQEHDAAVATKQAEWEKLSDYERHRRWEKHVRREPMCTRHPDCIERRRPTLSA